MFTPLSITVITIVLTCILGLQLILLAFYQFFHYMPLFKQSHKSYYKHLGYAIAYLGISGGLIMSLSLIYLYLSNIDWYQASYIWIMIAIWIAEIVVIQFLWRKICKSYGSQIKHVDSSDNVQTFLEWRHEGHYHDPQDNDK